MSLEEVIYNLQMDGDVISRFPVRVVFTNSLFNYNALIKVLVEKADRIIKLSDDLFCAGDDVLPDLGRVNNFLQTINDEKVLIPAIGEYLRFGEKTELRTRKLFSIITTQTLSKYRLWLPIFCGKDLFLNIIGELDDERYSSSIYEIEEESSTFELTVYSNEFLSTCKNNYSAKGIKGWIKLWDENIASSGAIIITGKYKLLSESSGIYNIHIIESPFEYLKGSIKEGSILSKDLGKDEHWTLLTNYLDKSGGKLNKLITTALNVVNFDAIQLLDRWDELGDTNNSFGRWLFWLWYKLGLNETHDYISFAVNKAKSYNEIPYHVENAILSDNLIINDFDVWVLERQRSLKALSVSKLSADFWFNFNSILDGRKKLKILTSQTIEERCKIIEVVSELLNEGKNLSDFSALLKEKFDSLYIYLSENKVINNNKLASYFELYKKIKIKNIFDDYIDELVKECDILSVKTRSNLLNNIKQKTDAYYLWIDGLGIEWLDLLINKISKIDSNIQNEVYIGSAVNPTITSVNMKNIPNDTFNEKYDDFDSISHVKDCNAQYNYFTIIAKQFEIIDIIANKIKDILLKYPDKNVVLTSDHGMSRLAALAFHQKSGIDAPKEAEVCSLGRYCIVSSDVSTYEYSNTFKDEEYLLYLTHHHFKCSGSAPGEIHGGMTPEEYLVPVILFSNKKQNNISELSYELIERNVSLASDGKAVFYIKTIGNINIVKAEIDNETIIGNKKSENEWTLEFNNLKVGERYTLFVYLNKLYNKNGESVEIKRRGIVIDDGI